MTLLAASGYDNAVRLSDSKHDNAKPNKRTDF